jgi:hypothetical protein
MRADGQVMSPGTGTEVEVQREIVVRGELRDERSVR